MILGARGRVDSGSVIRTILYSLYNHSLYFTSETDISTIQDASGNDHDGHVYSCIGGESVAFKVFFLGRRTAHEDASSI